jgi:predicted NUDIX family NTP pyrophosphohydrolase
MAKKSAGLIMWRRRGPLLEVLLVHPGGPFWKGKDLGAWSIPKGEYLPEEDPLWAATREFEEETGFKPSGRFLKLTPVTQPSGKIICAWAFEGDGDPTTIKSNTFSTEWPPRSGRQQKFPEVDRAAWFELEEAKQKIQKGQVALLDEFQHGNTLSTE